ncbi:hypothetical protein SEA_PINKYOSHI_39 [Mycobacterium phage PinkYoshi]|uniref:Uncharacterized protein n=4 Tax=Liefievirus TaxID=1623288 RepID=Q1A0P0_9CAUD|nr:hypothetical protein ANGEL_39 [Mycobacterium phage Angel]YP_010051449.1 hypothetical protein KDW72_gp39 [Mycobacterium phage Grizzly]YP_655556.1 hypothetical protein Halo39 [Mycobacterium phage Halo]ACB58198.1 hypothetical protein BPs1_39 [Mycobacterium phage BPs]ACU41503.1 hypothetical protein HOPE_39 [Mycobacterium phage Hope]AER48494.1 hypothetical protein AVRAFAN_39 [Mycobacterium phage Avrafan]AJK27307.1 hypothetical protein PBI_GOMASHI_39 [Mycobacterium phage Gomashi]AKY02643.1 hypo
MRAIAGGALAGLVIGVLVLAVGATAAAWIALALSVAAIATGAADYVRTH